MKRSASVMPYKELSIITLFPVAKILTCIVLSFATCICTVYMCAMVVQGDQFDETLHVATSVACSHVSRELGLDDMYRGKSND